MIVYIIVCLVTLYTAGAYRSSILITLFLTEIVIFAAMLILAVIMHRHIKLKIEKNTVYGYVGGSVKFGIEITNTLPMPAGKISYKLVCSKSKPIRISEVLDAKSRKISSASAACDHCGIMSAEYTKITVSDYLGIFKLKCRIAGCKVNAVVLPPIKTLKVNLSAFADGIGSMPAGGGIQDAIQLKKYQSGDTIKGIHWNIYARTDELYTRHTGDEDRYIPLFGIDTRGLSTADVQKKDTFYTICCALIRGFCSQYGSVKISAPYNMEINDENGIKELVHTLYQSEDTAAENADFMLDSDLMLKFDELMYKFDNENCDDVLNKGEIVMGKM